MAKPCYLDKELPEVEEEEDTESSCTLQERAELEEDWDHFSLLLESMLHRVPTMKVPDAS